MRLKKIVSMILACTLLPTISVAFADENVTSYEGKFDFGMINVEDGYTQVTNETVYTSELGYGLTEKNSGLCGGKGDDALRADYIVARDAKKGIEFTVDVPDGDYTVNVITGGDTPTNANIYINGGERVRAYTLEADKYQDNEQPVVPKDGKITIQVIGESAKINAIEVTKLRKRMKPAQKPTIYIAGDSTAQTYNQDTAYPQTGWGQVFADYMTDDVIVQNRSMGGRSLKSYNNDGRLDKILTEMYPGDYVFIQFGHNDGSTKPERFISPEDFKVLLEEKYIGEIKKRGGIPVVMTPTPNFSPDENGKFDITNKVYSSAAVEVAKKCGVLAIDIQQKLADKWNELGKEKVSTFYFINEKNESKAYPEGTDDHTHFKESGAREVARVVSEALQEEIVAFSAFAKDADYGSAFTDLDGHWSKNDVISMANLELVRGISETEFAPNKTVTRAEFLTLCMRAAGIVGHAYRDGECLDAAKDSWYRFDLQGAIDAGIIPEYMIDGYSEKTVEVAKTEKTDAYTKTVIEGKFNGEKAITREEMAVIALGCADYKDETLAQHQKLLSSAAIFKDTKEAYVINVASQPYNLMRGISETEFAPKATATRSQATTVASRLYKLINK